MTAHDSGRVPPLGHPRINAWLPAPRGLSQAPTSFFGSWCQGIHPALFIHFTQQLRLVPHPAHPPRRPRGSPRRALREVAKTKDARVHCAVLKQQPAPAHPPHQPARTGGAAPGRDRAGHPPRPAPTPGPPHPPPWRGARKSTRTRPGPERAACGCSLRTQQRAMVDVPPSSPHPAYARRGRGRHPNQPTAHPPAPPAPAASTPRAPPTTTRAPHGARTRPMMRSHAP